MAVANWYGKGLTNLLAGNYAWSNAYNIKAALLSGQYTPDEENHELWSHVSEYEVEGTGYSKVAMNCVGPTYLPVVKEIWFDSTVNIVYSGATFSARYIVLFADSGIANTQYLIGWIDLGENKIVQDNDFSFTWNENGIFRLRKS